MTFLTVARNLVQDALESARDGGHFESSAIESASWSVQIPANAEHGHFSTNVAMVLGKQLGSSPLKTAEMLAHFLRERFIISQVFVVSPGFINIFLAQKVFETLLTLLFEQGEECGSLDIGRGKKVHIEFVSANPTGPLHIGHARGAVFGDCLANLLEKVGYEVWREYYLNDAGGQIDALAQSVYMRYQEAAGISLPDVWPENFYKGDYLKPLGECLLKEYGLSLRSMEDGERLPLIRSFAVSWLLEDIKSDLEKLGVKHDAFFHENSLFEKGLIDETIHELEKKNLVYKGVLEEPKGKKTEAWKERLQLLFRSKDFGDDLDRALRKENGEPTYFASDMAYHATKINRGFDEIIDVLGADHAGYVRRLEATCHALGHTRFSVRVCQMVRLLRGGVIVRMSKRGGNFVTLRETLEEVDADIVRFVMLTRRHDAPLDFDFEQLKEQSRENWCFYVHYAYARICSVLRNYEDRFGRPWAFVPSFSPLAHLDDKAEQDIIKKLSVFQDCLKGAAEMAEPHRLTFYLYELASLFHVLWTRGHEDASMRFLQDEENNLMHARLWLLSIVRNVLGSGLRLIGSVPREEMR